MGPAIASKINPAFRSKYADLSDVADVAMGPLHDNGFAVSQDVANNADGVSVSTTLLHESGECLVSSPCWLPVAKKDAQGYGSAITYARRYSLAALLGIVVDKDDDGNAATNSDKREVPPPAGLESIKRHIGSNATRPTPPRVADATHDRNFSLNYGSTKGIPVRELGEKDLAWYRKTLTESVADPSKAQWADNNRRALDVVSAELKFRGVA